MLYQIKCNECSYKPVSFYEAQMERTAEAHMMETGHIVTIVEVN